MTRKQGIHVRVDPRAIEACFLRRGGYAKFLFLLDRLLLPYALRRGRWDRRAFPLMDHPTYPLMEALVDAGEDPERFRTLAAQHISSAVTSSGRPFGDVDIAASFGEYRRVAQDMRRNGYRANAARDQIGLAIARDGRLLKVARGHHRFALARALGLEQVIAEVRFAHYQWYRRHGGRRFGDVEAGIRAGLRAEGVEVLSPEEFAAQAMPVSDGREDGGRTPAGRPLLRRTIAPQAGEPPKDGTTGR